MIELWRWWPLLLIGFALRQRWRRRSGLPTTITRAECVLLVAVTVVGLWALGHRATPVPAWPRRGPGLGAERDADRTLAPLKTVDLTLGRGQLVDLTVERMSVTVESGPATNLKAVLSGVATEPAMLELEPTDFGARVRVVPTASATLAPHLHIVVPRDTRLSLRSNTSTISVRDVAALAVAATACDIAVAHLDGPITGKLAHGSLSANEVRGEISLATRCAATELREIQGNVQIQAEFGDIRLERAVGVVTIVATDADLDLGAINGAVQITAPRSKLRLTRIDDMVALEVVDGVIRAEQIRGQVTVRGDNTTVDLHDVTGDVTVATTLQAIQIGVVHGAVAIESRGGNVAVTRTTGDLKLVISDASAQTSDHSGSIVATITRGALRVDAPKSLASQHQSIEVNGRDAHIEVAHLRDGLSLDLSATPGLVYVDDDLAPYLNRTGSDVSLRHVRGDGRTRVVMSLNHGMIRVGQ